jgi:hypothetical protein
MQRAVRRIAFRSAMGLATTAAPADGSYQTNPHTDPDVT